MSAHTPGPWVECGRDRGGCVCGLVYSTTADVTVADANLSCDAETRSHRPDADQRRANARLIAAAPELLEALIQANRVMEIIARISPQEVPHDGSLGQMMRDAIAKATGGQP